MGYKRFSPIQANSFKRIEIISNLSTEEEIIYKSFI